MALFSAATLATLSLAGTAAGAGVSIYGQQQQARAQESAARANAKNLEQTAQAREAETHENLVRQAREARRRLASMRATMAGSGTQINDGSNADVLGAATTRLEVRIGDFARQQMMEQRALRQSAELQKWQGEQSREAANFATAGSLIGGFGQMARDGYQFKRLGAI